MTTSSTATRATVRAAALVGAAALGTLLLASPATAAPPSGGPSGQASCVGQVFVPQATGEPRAIADRIHEIKQVDLPLYGGNFGQAISGLARDSWCRER
jgi:hypothetical protein